MDSQEVQHGRNAVLKGKRWQHGKILLIVPSILPFTNTLCPFPLLQCCRRNMRCVLFILLFHLLSCFLLLALLLFTQQVADRDGERRGGTGQDGRGGNGADRGTEQEADGEGMRVRGKRRGTACGGRRSGAGQCGAVSTRGGVGNKGRGGAGGASGRGRAPRDRQTKHFFLRSRK